MGAGKNVLWGIIWAGIAVATYVLLPLITLDQVKTILASGIGSFDYTRFHIDDIKFFILSLGIIQVAFQFAKGSSPKYSKRKASFSLLTFGGSGAYLYIIKYSGLSQIPIILSINSVEIGILTVTFTVFVYMVSGIIVLNGVLAIFDLFIAIYEQKENVVYSLDKERKESKLAEESQEGIDSSEQVEKEVKSSSQLQGGDTS